MSEMTSERCGHLFCPVRGKGITNEVSRVRVVEPHANGGNVLVAVAPQNGHGVGAVVQLCPRGKKGRKDRRIEGQKDESKKGKRVGGGG
jgi:hypothetical protein